MACPICDQKPMNCDCTAEERRQYGEIEDLEDEIARLRLTDAERESLEGAIDVLEQEDQWHAAGEARIKTLRALLERLK